MCWPLPSSLLYTALPPPQQSSTYVPFFFFLIGEKKKKRGFSYFRWRGVIQQQPMNGSVMIQTSWCKRPERERERGATAERWRKIFRRCLCVLCTCTNVFIQRCVCSSVLCIYIYTHGNGAEKGKGGSQAVREAGREEQQQQAVGLFIKHEKVTGLSKRNVTK